MQMKMKKKSCATTILIKDMVIIEMGIWKISFSYSYPSSIQRVHALIIIMPLTFSNIFENFYIFFFTHINIHKQIQSEDYNLFTNTDKRPPMTPPRYPPTNNVIGHCCQGLSQSKGIGITPNQHPPKVNRTSDKIV